MLLRSAIVSGVDYIDLEEDVAELIPRYGQTKRIVSLHDFHQTPDDLPAVYAENGPGIGAWEYWSEGAA